MHPLMMLLMLAGGHSMMSVHGHSPEKVPNKVIDVRYQVCPVKGGKPLPKIAALRRNRVYHFCSRECLEAFNKNPRPVLRKIQGPQEVALRTMNPDGLDPVSGHPIKIRRNPPFLVRGDTITFYATEDSIGRDGDPDNTSPTGSHSGDNKNNSGVCH